MLALLLALSLPVSAAAAVPAVVPAVAVPVLLGGTALYGKRQRARRPPLARRDEPAADGPGDAGGDGGGAVKVAVVGAGVGGLCLAQGLLKAGLEVTVYEKDTELNAGGQGYRLHIDAGPALQACLPPDLYELCVATSGRPARR